MLERPPRATVTRPVVGVVCNRQIDDGVDIEVVRARYLEALRTLTGVVPVLIPTDLGSEEGGAVLARCDGVLLTGSASNVQPERYGQASEAVLTDRCRDETVFGLAQEAIERGIPVLGICRGLQELNVAFGGTLVQDLRAGDGGVQHDEDIALPRDLQYAPSHRIEVVPGGVLAELARGCRQELCVNSLHRQAIARPGNRVRVEAAAPDGVIEAISIAGCSAFALGVQWHPEWFYSSDPLSREIFIAFGAACAAQAQVRGTQG